MHHSGVGLAQGKPAALSLHSDGHVAIKKWSYTISVLFSREDFVLLVMKRNDLGFLKVSCIVMLGGEESVPGPQEVCRVSGTGHRGGVLGAMAARSSWAPARTLEGPQQLDKRTGQAVFVDADFPLSLPGR